MIKVESIHIEEMRGIRKLDLDFSQQKFVISGPNGSGKSGVIDAIEFGLTGQIGRLTGRGTKGLSVSEHGPHVDKTKFPDASFVRLRVFLTRLDKSATITRMVSSPNKPKIEPPDSDVVAALTEIADHPEITLSRREILRFILVEPRKRSEEIQAILKLEEIGQTRSALNAAQNKLEGAHKAAIAQVRSSRDALQLHLQITLLRSDDLLDVVNKRRKVLDLPLITELGQDTELDAGLSRSANRFEFNKESAQRDLTALSEAIDDLPELAKTGRIAILANLEHLKADPALFTALQRRSFLEKGIDLVDGPQCPLCDTLWDDERRLRDHLKEKLSKSDEARRLQEALLKNGLGVSAEIIRIVGMLTPIQNLAESQKDAEFSRALSAWKIRLNALKIALATVDGITTLRERLANDWLEMPQTVADGLKRLTQTIDAKPDQTKTLDAQTFLTTAQLRLGDYRGAMRKNKLAEVAWSSSKIAYETYCQVLKDELNSLYEEVQKDFSTFYRAINEDDESGFTAKLTPTEGSLGLEVNFYERGLFPPAAYHSEGHQDGMGVCLYLALMKRLFGDQFTFALLDDVVMSVDAEHRYKFAELLKEHFPNTQFIITTHDRLWAEQMKSAGLVNRNTSVAFYGWSIETGPLVESNEEIWVEIAEALQKGKVGAAASTLRHHLEYASRHLADQIGATPQFRADGNYELGDLLPSVLKRMKEILGKAADAAQSWGNRAEKDDIAKRKESLANAAAKSNVEQWAVNRAVHYNEWANFGKNDFEPVVSAFAELLECFRCEHCGSWLRVTPRIVPESVRCSCNMTSLNLFPRPKS